ncbi:hypothetical protein OAM69_02655 [bacterium]|nr:hypothetical protein [bacterium]
MEVVYARARPTRPGDHHLAANARRILAAVDGYLLPESNRYLRSRIVTSLRRMRGIEGTTEYRTADLIDS